MGVARVAGETAPIMFTAAYALRDQLPWQGLEQKTDFFFPGRHGTALPHLRCKFENPTERIHPQHAVWRCVCLPDHCRILRSQ